MSDGRSRARPARIEPVSILYPFSPPASQRSCLLQRVSQDRFIDEERIDVTDIVFFGIQAAVPMQFSGLRAASTRKRAAMLALPAPASANKPIWAAAPRQPPSRCSRDLAPAR